MATIERDDAASRVLGWGGIVLAIAGAVTIILAGGSVPIAIGILLPLLATAVLALLPAMRDRPMIWLLTGVWTAAIGAIAIFSVGIIFLIATVFLLAAFVRASRRE